MADINSVAVKNISAGEFIGNYQQNRKLLIFHQYGETVNLRDFDNFAKKHNDLDIILFDPIPGGFPDHYKMFDKYNNVDYFSLNSNLLPEEYRDVHPPTYVYEWYAQELIEMLGKFNYLNN